MRVWTSNSTLTCGLDLDNEDVDLTLGGLGEDILDFLADDLTQSANQERAPDGSRWEPLRPSTVKAKGHNHIGIKTGKMIGGLSNGHRDIQPRSLRWSYPGITGKIDGFHNGNPRTGSPARRLVGWSDRAERYARDAINGG